MIDITDKLDLIKDKIKDFFLKKFIYFEVKVEPLEIQVVYGDVEI